MRPVAPLLAFLVLSTVLVSPAAAATDDQVAPTTPAPGAVTAPDDARAPARLSAPANTTIEIEVLPNRSARWRVTVTYVLDSPNETAAFRRYAEDYRNNETTAGPSPTLFRTIVDGASAATGRRMAVRDVSRHARVGETTASVGISFVWTDMLERTDNRTIRLGDAVLLPANRTWLGTLDADQTLVIRTPEGYSIVDSEAPSFELRNNSVVIAGPAQVHGNLQITYRRTAQPDPGGGTPWGLVAGAVLVAAVVAGVVYARRRGSGSAADAPGPDAGPGDTAAARSGSDDAGGAAAGGPSGSDVDVPDDDLLSDEERVERLLRDNDGRMKQAAIVRETGWSDAKVSQLLSAMADDGRVEKLRLGRENLISLPDEDGDGSD